MLNAITTRQAILIIAAVAFATIAGAWIFEYFGFAPCELCLMQRWAYYTGIPLALILLGASASNPALARNGLYLLALLWLASAIFGVWHAGIEWKWWAGPSACTGNAGLSSGLPDLSKPVVMCDQPALRIFGLSLAGWNAVISFGLFIVALRAARGRSAG